MNEQPGPSPAATGEGSRRAMAPPAGSHLPDRAPAAPLAGSVLPSHYQRCFGCGPEHTHGLHVQVTAGEGLTVAAQFTVMEQHQGAPGLAHGGLLVTAIDDTLAGLNWLLDIPAVTGRLETSFRRPVPVGAVLHLTAEITGVHRRLVYCRAEARMNAADGPVAVTASAVFVQVPVQHFVTHGRSEDVEQAKTDEHVGHYLQHLEVNP